VHLRFQTTEECLWVHIVRWVSGAFAGVSASKHDAEDAARPMVGGLFGGADPMADLPVGLWDTVSENPHGLQ